MDNQTCLFIWYFDNLNHHTIPCKEVAQYVVFNGKEDLKAKKKKKNRSLEELSFYRLLGMPHSKATIINEVPRWLSLLFSHFLLLIFSSPLFSASFLSSRREDISHPLLFYLLGDLIKFTGLNAHFSPISCIAAATRFPKF